MWFWLFSTVFCLLTPLIMLYFGWRFVKKPPKNINGLYGYRTSRSMKNQQTWDFAHQVCGKIWFRVGAAMLPLSLIAMLPVLWQDVDKIGMWSVWIVGVQVAIMLATMFPVERALKNNFDQFGRKR